MTRHGLDAPDVLELGSWVPARGVLRWVKDGEEAPAARDDLHRLIACPTCRARVTQTCRSAGGNPVKPHTSRLAPRLCPCGSLLGWKKQMCPACSIEARLLTYQLREKRQPTRTRRRAA